MLKPALPQAKKHYNIIIINIELAIIMEYYNYSSFKNRAHRTDNSFQIVMKNNETKIYITSKR